MSKIYNYCAFYVAEPFNSSSLGAHATEDFCHYNMLKAWKGAEPTFPFNNSHDTTYNVRDSSDWETTLKPRLKERLRKSHNIILFLSNKTCNSRALREELDYGINTLKLPVIVIYVGLKRTDNLLNTGKIGFNKTVTALWDSLPIFKNSKSKVPVLHIPMNKETIKKALNSRNFRVGSNKKPSDYIYK